MGRPIIDITGKRFGKLTVLKLVDSRKGHATWLCRCDCGTLKTFPSNRLRWIRSCGCARSEAMKASWARRLGREDGSMTTREARAWKKAERERKLAEVRHEEYVRRQMIRNQEAGKAFDDFWMFGHDGAEWWRRITGSREGPEALGGP
jgi:hypothetical protein